MLHRFTVAALLVTIPVLTAADQSASSSHIVRVVITGAIPNEGRIIGQIFDSEESYLNKLDSGAIAEIDRLGRSLLEFQVVKSGSYAIAVFQDQNGNSKLDRNFIGVPKEPVGTSNNPKGRFGPPKWKAAKFSVTGEQTELKIRIDAKHKHD